MCTVVKTGYRNLDAHKSQAISPSFKVNTQSLCHLKIKLGPK